MIENSITTFIIPSIDRPTLPRAILSAERQADVLHKIDTERIGEGTIRNQLIEQATTEWVSFLDDDDTVTSDYVERLEAEIKANPDADLIYFRAYWADCGAILPAWPMTGGLGTGVFFSVKRDVALKYPFKSEPSEDQHFVGRLEEAGKKIVFSKYLTYRVRH